MILVNHIRPHAKRFLVRYLFPISGGHTSIIKFSYVFSNSVACKARIYIAVFKAHKPVFIDIPLVYYIRILIWDFFRRAGSEDSDAQ